MDIEQEIQAKGLTAPRVTPADLAANIASEHYFTACEGVAGAALLATCATYEGGPILHASLRLLTFCVLVLRNGFTVTGESACASPENFDAETGRKIARENAEQKIWPLMGYRLKDELHRRAMFAAEPKTGGEVPASTMPPHQQRVVEERAALDEKIVNLYTFTLSEHFYKLLPMEQNRLAEQLSLMQSYSEVLGERIEAFPPV